MKSADDDDDDENDNHDDHVGDDYDDNNDNIFECEDDYHTGCKKHQSPSTIVLLKTTPTQKIMLQATYLQYFILTTSRVTIDNITVFDTL